MARVPYLERDQLPPEGQAAFDQISATWGRVPRPLRLLLESPVLARQISDMLRELQAGTMVDPVAREIAILTIAREANSQFEWTYHEASAKRAGVRDLVIEGIKNRTTRGMIPQEHVFVDYAKRVLKGRVNDPTFVAVEHLLGRRGAVELTILIGYYAMFCQIGLALGLELPEGMLPLLPEDANDVKGRP